VGIVARVWPRHGQRRLPLSAIVRHHMERIAAIVIAVAAIALGYFAMEGLTSGSTRLLIKSGGVGTGLEGRLIAIAYAVFSIALAFCALMFLAKTESRVKLYSALSRGIGIVGVVILFSSFYFK
jgi:hypothetical protein